MAAPTRAWEYLRVSGTTETDLAAVGRAGWDLVGVTTGGGSATLYFKRPGLDFRERVALEQQLRVYDRLGLPLPHAPDADLQP